MIGPADLAAIDRDYFNILSAGGYDITLQSRPTGHCWHLLERVSNGYRSFVISHRHGDSGPYHPQKTKPKPSVEACCDYIKGHDAYQAQRDRAKEQRRQENRRRHMKAMGGSR